MATVVKRPSGKWQATVRRDGRSRSKSFAMRADAVRWARDAERDAERGVQMAAAVQSMTLADVLTRYRDDVTATKRCADTERCAINAFLRTKLSRTRLDKLTAAEVAAHRDKRLRTVKPSTAVRELGWLQHAIDIACADWQQHVPNGNPVKQMRRPRVDNRRERRLQAGEWERLMHAAHARANPLMPMLLTLAIETAMRRGELLAMEWRHVDLERCTVLPRTKNGHLRTVPLTREAVRTLAAQPRTDAPCLPMSGNAVRRAFERVRTQAGITDLTLHDIRHEATSRFVERGLSLAQVQMVTGHRDLRMLMRYTHLAVGDIVAALHAA